MILTIELIHTSIISQLPYFDVLRKLKIYSLSKFLVDNTVLLTIVTIFMLDLPELMKVCMFPYFFHSTINPQLLVTTIILSGSVSFPFLASTYQWDHVVCIFLCLAYFNIMSSRFIRVVTNGRIFFFSWLNDISLYIHGIFFIYSSTDGHLGGYYALPTVNNAAMNTSVQIFLQDCNFCSFDFLYFVLGVFWFFSWLHCAAYGILVPWPGTELWSTAGKAPSLNHWITREFTSLFPLSLISFEHMFSRRFANILVTWCKQFTLWKRPRCWGRLRGGGEGGDRGGDGWIVTSMTQWIRTWANSGRQQGTGRPGVLQSMGLQRVGHDWLTEQQERVCWTTWLSFLIFWVLSMQFSIRAEPVYITTKRTQNFHMGSWDASRWKIPQTREGFFSLFYTSGNLRPLREGGWFE